MATPVQLVDGFGRGVKVRVTPLGEMAVSALRHDDTTFKELAEADTAYNFYPPRDGEQFIITGIRGRADRDVSNTVDATVVVYEADANDSTTVDKTLYQENMVRGEDFTIAPVSILVRPGKFVNAKTTDDDIHMTIFGYYTPIPKNNDAN